MSTWSLDLGDLDLVPRPRVLVPTGIGPPADDCPVASVVDPSLPAQGFRLDITEDRGATIAHRDDAGLRYGLALLGQLTERPIGGRVLGVHVEDHPDLLVRAFMLDVSRDRVPTRTALDELIDVLALVRGNQLQLYIEHTFAHAGHEEVWAEASPLTADDLSWLDGRCQASGIELVVNRNCFGHFERWLRHPEHLARAEAPEGVEVVPGLRLPPSVLAPTPENAAFALDLVREQLACVRSRRVNIGCDETFELGRGASAAECAERGRGAVYIEHVRRLADPLLDDGYEVQVWADVIRRHPALAAQLPDGIVPVAWVYEAPTPTDAGPDVPPELAAVLHDLGIDTDASGGFEANVAPLVAAGIPFWVAPGTGDWNSLVGRWQNAVDNHVDAVETAVRHGAGGCLITAWGDHGHHHPPAVTHGSLVHAGAVAWCVASNRDLDVARVLDRHVFRDDAGELGGVVEALGRLGERTGRKALNASPLAAALLPHLPLLVTGAPDPAAVDDVLDRLADIDARLDRAAPAGEHGTQAVAELRAAARLARQGAWRLQGERGPSAADRADDLADAIEAQRAAWLGRARPGGLDDSLGQLERTLAADRASTDG